MTDKLHFPHMTILGILLMFMGIVIRYTISKRRFQRRTPTGLEWFPSYGRAVFTRLVESLAGLFGRILIGVGILLVIADTL